jgi:hypothetical protein
MGKGTLLHCMRRKPFQELAIDLQKLQGIMAGSSHSHALKPA